MKEVIARDRQRQQRDDRRRMPPPDGQCEATLVDGKRCHFRGWYDGLTGKVLCGVHAK
jgi:hypothetical protein